MTETFRQPLAKGDLVEVALLGDSRFRGNDGKYRHRGGPTDRNDVIFCHPLANGAVRRSGPTYRDLGEVLLLGDFRFRRNFGIGH